MNIIMRILLPCLAALMLLAGCATERAEQVATQLSTYVNRSEADLVRDLGVPTRTFEADGAKFLAYARTRRVVYGGWNGWGGPWGGPWGGWGGWGGWAGPAEVVDYTCEATFEVRGDRVQNVKVRGPGC